MNFNFHHKITACVIVMLTLTSATLASAASDSVTDLLRRQTDLGSDAGQRGDQATMESFLDRQVLFSGGDGSVGTVGDDPPQDAADAQSGIIKNLTTKFLAACRLGDSKVMLTLLDRKFVAIDENGAQRDRNNLHCAPDADRVEIRDWILHHDHNVAFSSYVREEHFSYGTQQVNYQTLSVDTWIKHGKAWTLLDSGLISLHQDPSPVILSAEMIANYAGNYSAGPGSSVVITVDGNTLLVSNNGAKALALLPALRDVFFRTGLPSGYARAPIVFQRNADGRIVNYVSNGVVYAKGEASTAPLVAPALGALRLRDFQVTRVGNVAVATFFHDRETPYYGQTLQQTYRSSEVWMRQGDAWKMITSQGRALDRDPPTVTLDARKLDDYVGVYSPGGGVTVEVKRAGSQLQLTAAANGAPGVTLNAATDDFFFVVGNSRMQIIFQHDPTGKISGYLNRCAGRDILFSKI